MVTAVCVTEGSGHQSCDTGDDVVLVFVMKWELVVYIVVYI